MGWGKGAFFVSVRIFLKKYFSEEKFEKIFHNIPIIATLTDLETNEYTEINRVFYRKTWFLNQ